MINVAINDRAFRDEVRYLQYTLTEGGQRAVLRRVGIGLRDAVRRRFTTSGYGTWAKLSKWTTAKTGRVKPLMNMKHRIQYRLLGQDGVQLYFDAPSGQWDIKDHDEGNVSPPVRNKKMAFGLRNPSAIGSGDSSIMFRNRKASVTPARRIWLTPAETKLVVEREVQLYIDKRKK